MAASSGSLSAKGKGKARASTPPRTLDSIIRSHPELLAQFEVAKTETSHGLHFGAAGSSQTRKRIHTSPTKADREEKRRREDETTTSAGNRDESIASREEGTTARRPGRPVKEEIAIGAVLILPDGTMDLTKKIKKPNYDDITSLITRCLAVRAQHRGQLVINRTWNNDEGLTWITTLFPDLTSLLHRRSPDESNFGLIPLAASGQTLRVVSGFEGAAFADRTGSAKGPWEKRILCFVTKYKLQPIDIAMLEPPVLPGSTDEDVQTVPSAGPSGLASSTSDSQVNSLRRSSRLMGESTSNNTILVHGSDSEEAPTTKDSPAPVPAPPTDIPLSQASSFVFTDPLAEFL
ncbi:hypothetical protein FRC01_001381 [Tulasnella sp. 417]|nr:hypothetical protein FRC01_001381 [Tulasnella sp. 417]